MSRTLRLLLCALVPLLCTCDRAQKTLFTERTDTGVISTNQLIETEQFNIVEYLYYYNGGGVAATDINGDGLPDLYFTNNQGPNKYYINEGDFKFRDATNEGGVAGAGDWSTGVSILDVNADDRMDIYVCNVSGYKGLSGRNELFLQNEDGTFTESAANYGLNLPGFNTQAYWFDYDLDGDLDLYLARHSVHNDATYGTAESRYGIDSLAGDKLFRNNRISPASAQIKNRESRTENQESTSPHLSPGEGPGERERASPPTLSAPPPTSSFRIADTPRITPDAAQQSPGFTDVTQESGILSSKIAYALSAAIADFNADGYPDIYVCNDFSENDYYYLNNQDGTFTEAVDSLTGHTSNFSMGSDVADFDADGQPDLFTLDMRPGNEEILKTTMSSDAWNVYQLKRKLGYHHQLPHNALQWNRGGGNFSEIAEMAGIAATDWSWSCLVEDFDRDGQPDVFVANGIERRPNSLDYLKFISSRLARSASNLEVIANMPDGHVANQAFRMTGEWTFEETGPAWGLDYVGSSTGAAVADFDKDGDLDLVLNNLNTPAKIYENTVLAPGELSGEELATARSKNASPPGRWSPQRGFQSQSEGSYPTLVLPTTSTSSSFRIADTLRISPDAAQRSPGSAPAPFFTVTPTGIHHTSDQGKLFDRDPLAPYAPSPVNYPLIYLKDGSYAIATTDVNNQYRIYRWNGESLEGGELTPIFAVQHQQIRGPARMPLKVLLPEDQETIYARSFNTIIQQMSGGSVDLAPEQQGMWQSLSQINGKGGAGTTLLAGNWGLNSVLGSPTPEEPVRLYLEDVDGNDNPETLLTYVRQGREVTVADKDELTASIPSLKRNQLSYTDYAAKSFSDLFGELENPAQTVSTLEHLRLVRNNGGSWSSEPLPRATQITTLNCALEVPQGILLGGNKMEVQPRIGRQDAAALQLLLPDGSVEFIDLGGERNRLEVRQLVRLDESNVLVLVAGEEHLLLTFKGSSKR